MEYPAGKVLNYYRALGVASIEITDSLAIGDMIQIKGRTTNFDQKVESMQLQHRNINEAVKGQIIGLKVIHFVRKNDVIYKIKN
ncbi:MAG: hypothetical protein JSV11_03280 [Nitrospiraceae bacterium]|nr:MAG: hypothetical protein JSV11_03280 [Nitrospiraceae bacterium]